MQLVGYNALYAQQSLYLHRLLTHFTTSPIGEMLKILLIDSSNWISSDEQGLGNDLTRLYA